MSCVQHYTLCKRCDRLQAGKQSVCLECQKPITKGELHTFEHLNQDTVRVSTHQQQSIIPWWSVVGMCVLMLIALFA